MVVGNHSVKLQRTVTMKFEMKLFTSGFLTKQKKVFFLSGPILQEKAKIFVSKLGDGYKEFCASFGWLDRGNLATALDSLAVSGEQLSSDWHNCI